MELFDDPVGEGNKGFCLRDRPRKAIAEILDKVMSACAASLATVTL